MHLLPTTLAPLADVADRKDSGGRFALTAVHLRLHGDDTFTAEATDTKMLIRVTGPCVAPAADYPDHAGMTAAPNGRMDALIPVPAWKKAFGTVGKVTRRARAGALASIAVKLGKDLATFGATDLDSYPVEQTRLVEGKFPPAADIIDKARKQARVKFAVDPRLAARLLDAMAGLVCDEENQRVEVEIGDPNHPILITGRHVVNGVEASGILMPLETEKPKNGATVADGEADEDAISEATKAELATLREKLAAAEARRDDWKCQAEQEANSWRAAVKDRDETIGKLLERVAGLEQQIATGDDDRRQMDVVRGWLADLGPRLRGESGATA